MTMSDRVKAAALNNALWINEVCLAHGCSTRLRDSAWFSFDATPPFYPNAVTLDGPDQSILHHEIAQELREAVLESSFAIKDSFCALSLESLGFRTLFEAQWIHKRPGNIVIANIANVEWERIETSDSLSEWEQAWAGESDTKGVFLPALLHNPDVQFIAARQDGRIIAGCIANIAAECVGISNIFLPNTNERSFRQSCVSQVQLAFPDLPVVGYESGSNLNGMLEIGFEAIGPLRVWAYESSK